MAYIYKKHVLQLTATKKIYVYKLLCGKTDTKVKNDNKMYISSVAHRPTQFPIDRLKLSDEFTLHGFSV